MERSMARVRWRRSLVARLLRNQDGTVPEKRPDAQLRPARVYSGIEMEWSVGRGRMPSFFVVGLLRNRAKPESARVVLGAVVRSSWSSSRCRHAILRYDQLPSTRRLLRRSAAQDNAFVGVYSGSGWMSLGVLDVCRALSSWVYLENWINRSLSSGRQGRPDVVLSTAVRDEQRCIEGAAAYRRAR